MAAIQSFSEMSIIRGTVSNVKHSSETSGHISGVSTNYVGDRAYVSGGGGSISTTHSTTFRVDGKPITWNSNLEIADGDKVSVAAIQGALGVCVVNDTSSAMTWHPHDWFEPPKGAAWVFGSMILMALSLGSCLEQGRGDRYFLIGLLLLGAAIVCFRTGSKITGKKLARLNDISSQRRRILEQTLRDSNGTIADAIKLESQIQA